eukprot:4426805-Lingulodinium_polyedra.AAC.1
MVQQFSRESCSGMRSEVDSIVAAPRIFQCARRALITIWWSTQHGALIAKCASPHQWNAFLSACLSGSRARVAQIWSPTCCIMFH